MLTADDIIRVRRNDPSATGLQQIQAAIDISKVSYYIAAKYLAVRGWSIEAALWILLRK